jgi:hypothetical protein
MKLLPLFIMISFFIPASATAQPTTDEKTTQQLVDELKKLTDQAEQNRTASYRFIDQLRDLTARYDWPCGKEILFDNFRDGDFQRNPSWNSSSDAFWVTRSVGLQTQLSSRRGSRNDQGANQSVEETLLGIIIESTMNKHQQKRDRRFDKPDRADIYAAVPVSNAFAIKLKISSMGRDLQDGSFEWGPYQGQTADSGYRLVYQAGNRPALKLVAYRRGMSSVVDLYDRGKLLEDGNMHKITWQRSANGQMTVLFDGQQIMQVRDRSYRDPFNGFVMTNRGGDYAIRSVSIFGANR